MPGIIWEFLGAAGIREYSRNNFYTARQIFVRVRARSHVIHNMATGGHCSSTCSSNAVDTQSSVSEVESDTSSTSCSATPAPSLLDRLKVPQKSHLARKRAINQQRQVLQETYDSVNKKRA